MKLARTLHQHAKSKNGGQKFEHGFGSVFNGLFAYTYLVFIKEEKLRF